MPDEKMTFMVEDAELYFRNFSGIENPFNKSGDRNFGVFLDERLAKQMLKDGWNVKYTTPREEGDDPRPFISIKVKYKIRPPRITMITSTARTPLTEESVGVLDWADIQTCDIIAVSSNWTMGDKSGIAAYLQTMFVTVQEDALEAKYAIQQGD